MRAGGEIDLLDFDPDFLGEGLRRFTALGRLSEIANALIGPVERQYECCHVFLHWMNRSKARRSRGKSMPAVCRSSRERPKGWRCYRPADSVGARESGPLIYIKELGAYRGEPSMGSRHDPARGIQIEKAEKANNINVGSGPLFRRRKGISSRHSW